MRKISLGLLSCLLMGIFLVGCSQESNKESVEVKISESGILNEVTYFQSEGGHARAGNVYLLNQKGTQYIVLYGLKVSEENVAYDINESTLEIVAKTSSVEPLTLVYEVTKLNQDAYNKIQVVIDGVETPFACVIIEG